MALIDQTTQIAPYLSCDNCSGYSTTPVKGHKACLRGANCWAGTLAVIS